MASKQMNSLQMKLARAEMAVVTEQLVQIAADKKELRVQLEDFTTPECVEKVVRRSQKKLSKATFNYSNIKQQIQELESLESADND